MAESDQLSLVGSRLRVTLTYFPEPRPVDGEYSAALADFPSIAGLGDTERGAIEDLAVRLKRAAEQTGPAAGVTATSQAFAAACRYDLEQLADFLEKHAETPVLWSPQDEVG